METVPLLLHLSRDDYKTLEILQSKLAALLGLQITPEDIVRYCILYAASSEGIHVHPEKPTLPA